MRRDSGAQSVRLFILSVLTIGLVVYGVSAGRLPVPAQWNPFAPFDVNAPRNVVTPLQYWRTLHNPQLCLAALARSGTDFRPLPDQTTTTGCPLHEVVRIARDGVAGTAYNHAFIATCPLALALARFTIQDVQPAAQAVYGQPVREINHVGSYACRTIRTNDSHGHPPHSGTLSEHARGNAIDVTGFVLQDGHVITIAGSWRGEDADSRFLHAVHDGACRAFDTTLGPDYNALHRTHFHLDMGPYHICD